MALLSNFVRRILGPMSFPRFRVPEAQIEPQVYQPPLQVKTNSVPPVVNPPPPI